MQKEHIWFIEQECFIETGRLSEIYSLIIKPTVIRDFCKFIIIN